MISWEYKVIIQEICTSYLDLILHMCYLSMKVNLATELRFDQSSQITGRSMFDFQSGCVHAAH